MAYQARIAVTAGLLLATAMPVTAQDRFVHVQYALRPGDTVFVVDDTGTETRGKVASIGPSALRLIVDGYERDWGAAAVERLERRGDSLKNGAISGLATGGIFGFLAIGAVIRAGGGGGEAFPLVPSNGQIAVVFGAFMGLGAGIGAGIDALVPGRTLLYLRPRNRTSVVPLVTPTAQSIQLRVAF
jgi:hypothetical protein